MNRIQRNWNADQKGSDSNEEPAVEADDVHWSALLKGRTLLSKELKDFKQDMRQDLSDLKNDGKKTMEEDLAEF